jgi:hypothetical protein
VSQRETEIAHALLIRIVSQHDTGHYFCIHLDGVSDVPPDIERRPN